MDRRTFLRLLLATPLATTVDVEALIWVPKPIIVVPAFPMRPVNPNLGQTMAALWERYVGTEPADKIFNHYWLLSQLKERDP